MCMFKQLFANNIYVHFSLCVSACKCPVVSCHFTGDALQWLAEQVSQYPPSPTINLQVFVFISCSSALFPVKLSSLKFLVK